MGVRNVVRGSARGALRPSTSEIRFMRGGIEDKNEIGRRWGGDGEEMGNTQGILYWLI